MRVTPVLVVLAGAAVLAQPTTQLDQVMARVGAYVAAYGEKSSVVVAKEVYEQDTSILRAQHLRPRKLVAEFAIVRTGNEWSGFRDVIEVDGEPVPDRKDRLAALLTSASPTVSEATRIANESSRFNVGPIARNFNTPTTAMFFFLPERLHRFSFTRKDTSTIDRVPVMEIAFRETRSPTFVMTRAGKDVPLEGTLWVSTVDGTVLRTRIRMRNFADSVAPPRLAEGPPAQRAVPNPNVPTGGREAIAASAPMPSLDSVRVESSAEIEVTYRRPPGIDLWLPATMVERYAGPIYGRMRAFTGTATTRATYSNFKQFSTTSKIIPQ
jgi:hypothetical protein